MDDKSFKNKIKTIVKIPSRPQQSKQLQPQLP